MTIFIITVILKDEELALVYDDSPGKGTVIGSFSCVYSLVFVISIINIYTARKIIGFVKASCHKIKKTANDINIIIIIKHSTPFSSPF